MVSTSLERTSHTVRLEDLSVKGPARAQNPSDRYDLSPCYGMLRKPDVSPNSRSTPPSHLKGHVSPLQSSADILTNLGTSFLPIPSSTAPCSLPLFGYRLHPPHFFNLTATTTQNRPIQMPSSRKFYFRRSSRHPTHETAVRLLAATAPYPRAHAHCCQLGF